MTSWHHKTGLEKSGLRIVKLLQQDDFKAFWVGGTVRSLLLNQKIDNLDIATSAKPDETELLMNKNGFNTKPLGKAFGTILVVTKFGPIEITTFRKEGRYLDRRHPETVTYIDDYNIDSTRRDFTINAMYYNPITKVILDPQNGQIDLQRKLLKFVGNPKQRIDEDALRMLRAVRFYTQLGFKIEKNSFAAIKTRAKYIQQISGERVKSEIDKILTSWNKSAGLRKLDELGILRFIMPEVTDLKKMWHKSKIYHLEGSVFEHTMLVAQNIKNGNPLLAYAALFHDTGKHLTAVPKKKEEGVVNSFPNHENISGDLFLNFAKRFKFSRKDTNLILWITQMHMKRISFVKDMSEDKKIQLASHKYFPELLELWKADAISKLMRVDDKIIPALPYGYKEGIKLLRIINTKKKIVERLTDGKIIMRYAKIPPGPMIGRLKKIISKKIFSNEIKNRKDLIIFLKSYAKNT